MKISFVLGHELPFPPKGGGGVNSLLHSLTIALARHGHQVTAYSPTFPGCQRDEAVDGVRHVRIRGTERRSSNLRNVIAGLPYVLRVRSAISPCDVLSCHLLTSFLLKPIRDVKLVTHTIHRDPKRYLLLYRHLDRIYCGSDAVSEAAHQFLGNAAYKAKTIYNCVDMDGYPPRRCQRGETIEFLYVGRFSRDKGIETMVRAFMRLAAVEPRARLATVGPQEAGMGAEPDFLNAMRTLVESAGLGDRIRFEKPIFNRPGLDQRVSAADVICLPSLGGETLNMAVLECVRLAKPVLISDLPANRPLVVDGLNGFSARMADIDDWHAVMQRFVKMKAAQFEEMSAQSYNFVASRFSSDFIANAYVKDFQSMLD